MTHKRVAASYQPQANAGTAGSHEWPDFADQKADGIDIRMVFEIGGKDHARKLGGSRSLHPGKRVRVDRDSGLRSDLSSDGGIFFGSGENAGKSREKIGFELPGRGGEPAMACAHEASADRCAAIFKHRLYVVKIEDSGFAALA